MAQLGAPSIEMSKFFAWLLRRALNAGVDIGSAVSSSGSVTFFWPLQIFYVSLLFFGFFSFPFFYCFSVFFLCLAQQPKPEKWHRNPEWAPLGF